MIESLKAEYQQNIEIRNAFLRGKAPKELKQHYFLTDYDISKYRSDAKFNKMQEKLSRSIKLYQMVYHAYRKGYTKE